MLKYKLTYFNARCRAEPIRMLFFLKGVEFEDVIVGADEWPKIKHSLSTWVTFGAILSLVRKDLSNNGYCKLDPFKQILLSLMKLWLNLANQDLGYMFNVSVYRSLFSQRKPLGQVPVLECDDIILTQSRAIVRYLGREFGYYGKTSLEGAQIDCVMDTCDPVILAAGSIYQYQGPGQFDPKRFLVDKKEAIRHYSETIIPNILTDLQTLFHMNKCADGFFVGDELTIADLFYYAAFDFAQIFKKDIFDGFPEMAGLYSKILVHKKVAKWLKKTNYQ